jgi:methyl acetate hydrolase
MVSTRRVSGMRRAGSGGRAGVANTLYWIDRESRLAAALYTQTLPFHDKVLMAAYAEFKRALYCQLGR